jgi:uncharacterized protein
MHRRLEIRDPVHGFIYREPDERDIMDTPVFQRLRRLKQLALASLVYPGATHSRFEHSLGAFHVAGKLAEALNVPEAERRLVRLAALLHDIGHGPFSHVAEPILRKHSAKDKLGAVAQESKIHELISWQIIRNNEELSVLLSGQQRNQIIGLLDGTWGHSYLQELVSGPIDADKQDYLLRDSLFSGVKYGVYDQERLGNTLLIHEDAEDSFLAISIDGLHALEQFVLAKYYMTTQVYRHKIRLITDQMITRAIDLGIDEDKIPWLKTLYSYDGSEEYINEYVTWFDDRLITKIMESQEGYAQDLFTRLQNRQLFKCILDLDSNDFPDPQIRSFVFGESKDFYKSLEMKIADLFGFDKNHVIAYKISFESAARTESEIPVVHHAKATPTLFTDESSLFKSVDQKIREQRFQVYAPAKYRDEKEKKKKLREFKTGILDLIAILANPQRLLPGLGEPK